VPVAPEPVPEDHRSTADPGPAARYRARRDRIVAELLAELGDSARNAPDPDPGPGPLSSNEE
jgi:hypothetical protein